MRLDLQHELTKKCSTSALLMARRQRGRDSVGIVARHVTANAGVGLDFRVCLVCNLDGACPVLGDGWGNVVVGGDCLNVLDNPEKLHTSQAGTK
jgi:hypothetical protein